MEINRRKFVNLSSFGLAAPGLISAAGLARAQKIRRLVGVIEEDPAIINPGITTVISSFASGCPVYSALTWMDASGNLHPDLAEKWEVSPDALNYTFYLRKNVKWHDGKPFSAEDVKFSLENIAKKLHPWGKGSFASMIEVFVVNLQTVVVRLERPFPALMASTTNSISAILPRHIWKDEDPLKSVYNRKPVGTGPFKLVEHRQGDRLVYRKNPDFYFPGQPAFDELVLRVIPDASARVAAFENGEVDMLYGGALPTSEVQRVTTFANAKVKTSTQGAPAYLCTFNTRSPALGDVRVRKAIAHAVDRVFLRNAVMPGLNDQMVGPVPAVLQLSNKSLKDYEFNKGKATALLDEAGHRPQPDGTRLRMRLLFNTSDTRASRIGDIFREQLGQVGIRVELQPLERATLMQKGYTSGEFEMIVDSFLLGPDPAIGVERLYVSSNRFTPMRPFTNNSNYANAEVDKLFQQEKQTTSFNQRKPIYDKIQELIWADIPVLPVFSYRAANVHNSKAVVEVFDSQDGSKESYARARPA